MNLDGQVRGFGRGEGFGDPKGKSRKEWFQTEDERNIMRTIAGGPGRSSGGCGFRN